MSAEPSAPRPPWLDHLVDRMGATPPSYYSRFLPPEAGAGRRAGVLVLVGPRADDPARQDVLLTERAHTMRSYAGQVSFPGGSLEPGEDVVAAALRESHEEVGLRPETVEVLASVPELYMPHRDFGVTPVVAWWRDPHPVAAVDPGEVAAVLRAPLDELVDPANRFTVTHPSGYRGPAFAVDGLLVWGFTAGVLTQLLSLAGLDRPWDRTRHEPLPERMWG
ncbi:NUDIX hydrolase [Arsenicicoccus dermatophilus]|uniref:NUDIX hydrolase n=1 Tax=Arsenicicoccus dermatophilus TaxID=1076331 RepID=UPI001F4CC907|nr:CoA pyrophosphatase [Arsenicicoccus dermatophilus]